MLRSLWSELLGLASRPAAELALARYYREEGLQVELESLRYGGDGAIPSSHERVLQAARAQFAA